MALRIKSLSFFIKSLNGRNNQGRLTSPNKGGGFKFLHFTYDDCRKVVNLPFIILKKKVYIAKSFNLDLICYSNGFLSYVRSIHKTNKRTFFLNSFLPFQYEIGDRLSLCHLVIGLCVNNIESVPLNGAVFCKSFGAFGKIICHYTHYVLLQFNSGRQRLILNKCLASVGICGGVKKKGKKNFNKITAGDMRNLGKRPHVRGIAKNPVDHPNGGRTKGGCVYKDK